MFIQAILNNIYYTKSRILNSRHGIQNQALKTFESRTVIASKRSASMTFYIRSFQSVTVTNNIFTVIFMWTKVRIGTMTRIYNKGETFIFLQEASYSYSASKEYLIIDNEVYGDVLYWCKSLMCSTKTQGKRFFFATINNEVSFARFCQGLAQVERLFFIFILFTSLCVQCSLLITVFIKTLQIKKKLWHFKYKKALVNPFWSRVRSILWYKTRSKSFILLKVGLWFK